MRAWLIAKGGLQLGDIDLPEPGPTELRVRVESVGINRADLLQVKGRYPAPPGVDPRVPGLEYGGVVEAVGARVLRRRVGDRVMGLVPGGAYAEYLLAHEAETILLPQGLDAAAGGALPEAFLTAYRALFLVGGLQAGQTCLIRPASSSVGLAAVQLATALGARALGTSRKPERLSQATSFGLVAALADDAFLAAAVASHSGGAGAAVVLDQLGGDLGHSLASLRDEGTLVLIGLLAGAQSPLPLGDVLQRRLSLRAMTMRSLPLDGRIQMARLFTDRLSPLFETGRLRPFIAAEYDFKDAPQAHADMAAGKYSGKLILRR